MRATIEAAGVHYKVLEPVSLEAAEAVVSESRTEKRDTAGLVASMIPIGINRCSAKFHADDISMIAIGMPMDGMEHVAPHGDSFSSQRRRTG